MIITSLGGAGIRLQTGDTVVVVNPTSKSSKRATKKPTASGADVCLVSAATDDYNGSDLAAYGDREPYVIDGPGEYEVAGVPVQAFGTISKFGKDDVMVTSFLLQFDNMNVLVAGPVSNPGLSAELREALDNVDVLIVPVGGGNVLDGAGAWECAKKVGARLVIPVEYDWNDADKTALKDFLKSAGAADAKPEDKVTIKLKDIVGKTGTVAVLAA